MSGHPYLGSSLRGDTRRGVAADLINQMMDQPVCVGTSLGGNARFTDPLALADRLLDLRVEMAEDWIEALRRVPEEQVHTHTHIYKYMYRVNPIMYMYIDIYGYVDIFVCVNIFTHINI